LLTAFYCGDKECAKMLQGLMMIGLSMIIYKYIRVKIFSENDPIAGLLGMIIFGSFQFTLLFLGIMQVYQNLK